MAQPTTSDVYTSAEQLFLAGNLDQARGKLEAALNQNDNAGELWELLEMVTYSQGEYTSAVDALEQASLLIPLATCSQYVLASCYEKQEELATAHAIYQYLGSGDSLDDHLLEPVARALGRVNDCEGALRVCRLAASRHPDAPERHSFGDNR